MAVSVVRTATVLATTAGDSAYTAASQFAVDGGADHCLVVLVNWLDGGSITPTATTVNTPAGMTRVASVEYGGGVTPGGNAFYRVNPTAGAITIRVVFDGAARACTITAIELAGVDPSNPVGSIVTTDGAGGQSVAIGAASGSMILGGVSLRGGSTDSFTALAGVAKITDAVTGSAEFNDIRGFAGYMPIASAGARQFGASHPSTSIVCCYAFEVKAGSAAQVIAGSGAASIGYVQGASAGSIPIRAAGAGSTVALTASATARLAIIGRGIGTIPPIGGSSMGSLPIEAASGILLPTIDGAASGSLAIAAVASAWIGVVRGASSAGLSTSSIEAESIAAVGEITGAARGRVGAALRASDGRTILAPARQRAVAAHRRIGIVTARALPRLVKAMER